MKGLNRAVMTAYQWLEFPEKIYILSLVSQKKNDNLIFELQKNGWQSTSNAFGLPVK